MELKFAVTTINKLITIWKRERSKREKELDEINNTFNTDVDKLVNEYIFPDCQSHSPADYDEDGPMSQVRIPIFNFLNNFLSPASHSSRDGSNQLFLLSDAGMGKTSLLVMLKVLHMFSFFPKGYECALLKLDQDTIPKIKNISKRRKTFILLDSLDEDSEAWGKLRSRIEELLHETKSFMRVLVTCRTQFFPEPTKSDFDGSHQILISGFRCPIIYISPFNNDQVMKFLDKKFSKKRFGIRFTKKKSIEKAKKIIFNMQSLRFRPMLLSKINSLVKAEKQFTNIISIYDELIRAWLMREWRKKKWDKRTTIDMVEKALIVIASEMSRSRIRHASSDFLNSLSSLNATIGIVKKIDISGHSLMNTTSNGEFRFSHFSIQEFLTAKRIATDKSYDINLLHLTDQTNNFLNEFIENYPIPTMYDALISLRRKSNTFRYEQKRNFLYQGENAISLDQYEGFLKLNLATINGIAQTIEHRIELEINGLNNDTDYLLGKKKGIISENKDTIGFLSSNHHEIIKIDDQIESNKANILYLRELVEKLNQVDRPLI